ncbi:MAG: ABC transporter ATP-binding protein [Candidatus Geothermarchaeales archaeon]
MELVGITKRFRKITALRKIDLSISDGEYVTVLGSTGAGKTTLLHVISGILKPDSGEVYIEGKLVNETPPEERRVSYFPQNYALFPHMTAMENVAYGLIARGASEGEARSSALKVLRLVGLDKRADAYPRELSGGMQQRIALARALATGSKLLLLDEPLSALDAILRIELRYELRKMAEELDLTVVHVTHDQSEALSISDRVVVLRSGVIEQFGTPFEIYEEPRNIFVSNFVGEMNFYEGIVIGKDEAGVDIEVGGKSIRVGRKVDMREAVIAVRPESLGIVKGRKEDGNWIQGTVKGVSLSAGFLRFEVDLVNDREVLVKRRSALMMMKEEIGVNDEVSVYFDPDRVLVYPYPREGLYQALEVT